MGIHPRKTLLPNPSPPEAEVQPQNSQSQARLPCPVWWKCFCTHRAIKAGVERARFAGKGPWACTCIFNDPPPNRNSTGTLSVSPQARPAHSLSFHCQDFSLQSPLHAPEQGRSVQHLLALSAEDGSPRPLPLLCSQHRTSGQPGFVFTAQTQGPRHGYVRPRAGYTRPDRRG